MTPKNTICLWFDKDAQDAAQFYSISWHDTNAAAFTADSRPVLSGSAGGPAIPVGHTSQAALSGDHCFVNVAVPVAGGTEKGPSGAHKSGVDDEQVCEKL